MCYETDEVNKILGLLQQRILKKDQLADITAWWPRRATANTHFVRTMDSFHRDNKCHNANILSQKH